jgi:hypothetical protein
MQLKFLDKHHLLASAKLHVAAPSTFQASMADQPTSLPIQKSLLNATRTLAKELNISWSRLITLALRDFIRRYQGRQDLVDQINAAYAQDLDDDETHRMQAMRSSHRHLVEGEW